MADRTLQRLLAKARSGSCRNTEAYLWLRPKFERLYPLLKRRKLTFQEVADDLAVGGIRGGRSKPLTADAARRIWNRVQRDVAQEEPWRLRAVQNAMQHGGALQKPRTREPERGKDADRPPPVVTTPTPVPPVPHYPPPPTTSPVQTALHSRPNASANGDSRPQTPEEMLADLDAIIKQRSRYF